MNSRDDMPEYWDDGDAVLVPVTRQERRSERRRPKMPVNGTSVKLLAELSAKPRKRKKGRRA
jgi:hypothetical protein